MSIHQALNNATDKDNEANAEAVAAIFNADRVMVRRLEGRTEFSTQDVQRLWRILSEYASIRQPTPLDALRSKVAPKVREEV